ncbi:MAG TPA: hypothetical protein PK358_15805 [Spirochaetota bacterium]|nr:hypothetical protein [Spirochaetota bacterium]HPJ36304.1 hypothetical protein [Spirochaetota bacterium]
MDELKLYTDDFMVSEEDIFKALREIKAGELLPSGGIFAFFYENVANPSTVLFLKTKKKAKFFYIDHDDFILALVDQSPNWVLDIDKNILRLNLIYEIDGSSATLAFVFDVIKEEFRNTIRLLAKRGVFDLYFFSILYGGLVLEKRIKYTIPKSILKTFKSIK